MSSTKTIEVQPQNPSLQHILDDYAIHSTLVTASHRSPVMNTPSQSILYFHPDDVSKLADIERQPSDFDPTVALHPTVPYEVSNPPHWTTWFRHVPDYRPVNKGLDRSERKQGAVVMLVGNLMLVGCSMIANGASALRNTLGKLIPDIDRNKVGGEW